MKSYRLSRLFRAPTRRCVGISFAPVRTATQGTPNVRDLIRELACTGIDALHLPLGLAAHLQSIEIADRPALIVQADVTNVTAASPPTAPFCRTIDNLAEHAIRADAACISVRLFEIPEAPELAAQCMRNIQRLKTACDRFCIPMLVDCKTPGSGSLRRALDAGADILAIEQPGELGAMPPQQDVPLVVRLHSAAPGIAVAAERALEAGASGILVTASHIHAGCLSEIACEIHVAAHQGALGTH